MKLITFRAFALEQHLGLRIPYAVIGLLVAMGTLLGMYGHAYTTQTALAQAIEAGTLAEGQLEAGIAQMKQVMALGLGGAMAAALIGMLLTGWRVRVLEAAYCDQVLRRLDGTLLMKVARSEEMDEDARLLAQRLLAQRRPGWSMETTST